MAHADAATTLRELETVRQKARGSLNASWLAFLIWGTIVLASAPFTQIGDGAAVGVYWMLATPLGLLITWRAYRSYELRIGLVDRNERLYAAIIATMVVAAFVLGAAGQGGMLSAVGPLIAIGVGLVALGVVKARDLLVAFAGDAMIVLGIVIAVADPDDPALLAALGQGAITILAGLIALERQRSSQRRSGPEPAKS